MLFNNTHISLENGKDYIWDGILNISCNINDKKFMIHNDKNVLKFIVDKHQLVIKNRNASLFFIIDSSKLEQEHAKITENKYSQLIVSTITHDFKSPIAAIQGNLDALESNVDEEFIKYLKAAQIAAKNFEFYIYDLIVYIYQIIGL